jgi:hypothetical protein
MQLTNHPTFILENISGISPEKTLCSAHNNWLKAFPHKRKGLSILNGTATNNVSMTAKHTMCLIAMSSDFLDIVLPNPFSSLDADREGLAG